MDSFNVLNQPSHDFQFFLTTSFYAYNDGVIFLLETIILEVIAFQSLRLHDKLRRFSARCALHVTVNTIVNSVRIIKILSVIPTSEA